MKRAIRLLPLLWAALSACSQYDTDVVGEDFVPFNGVVGPYTHQVYVEFQEDDVRVWGPASAEVEVEKRGARVTLSCTRDSMAYFCYGTVLNDSLHQGDGQLHIVSKESFALYLNSLRITSLEGPAIWCETEETTHLVLTGKTASILNDRHYAGIEDATGWMVFPDACLLTEGPLTFNGNGVLRVNSVAPSYNEDEETYLPHAIHARGGLKCSYAVKVFLNSLYGDAIHVDATDVAITDGTWTLNAGRYGVANEDGGLLLAGGSLSGTSADAFVYTSSEAGFSVSEATCIAASGKESMLTDVSAQTLWQQHIDTLTLMADTTYVITRKDTAAKAKVENVGSLVPRQTLSRPWLLLSSPTITPVDTIRVQKK